MWYDLHDGVDTGELAEEDHNVCVDDGTAGARLGEEVHPWETVCAASSNLGLFHFGADLHDEELLASFVSGSATDTLPNLEGFEWLVLVHQVPRAFGHEEDTNTHNGREDERAAEDISPAVVESDEHGGNGIAENFSESNVELVERDEVTAKSGFDCLGNINGDSSSFKTDTGA